MHFCQNIMSLARNITLKDAHHILTDPSCVRYAWPDCDAEAVAANAPRAFSAVSMQG